MRKLLLPALLLSTCSCAAIVTGSTQKVRLVASPNDATALLDGGAAYTGVRTLELDRGRDHNVTIAKPGYKPEALKLERRMNPWVWGNLALGPLFFVGVLIDSLTGAAGSLRPGDITVALAPEDDDGKKHTDEAPEQPRDRRVLSVAEIRSPEKGPLAPDTLRALAEQMRVLLAERRVRVAEHAKVPATHLLRASVARFGNACIMNGELIELSREIAIAVGSTRADCTEEAFLDAAERLTDELLSAP